MLSINALFPYLQQGDINTLNLALIKTWKNTMKKLRTIIEVEINERTNNRRYNILQDSSNDEMDVFIQLAARVIFIVNIPINLINKLY